MTNGTNGNGTDYANLTLRELLGKISVLWSAGVSFLVICATLYGMHKKTIDPQFGFGLIFALLGLPAYHAHLNTQTKIEDATADSKLDNRFVTASHANEVKDAVSRATESVNRVSTVTTKDLGQKLDEVKQKVDELPQASSKEPLIQTGTRKGKP